LSGRTNDVLRAAREAAGFTQQQLADLANLHVEAATRRVGAMDADYIGKLERGVHSWPNKDYRQALCTALRRETEADLGFFSSRSRTATVTSGPRYVDGGDDVERKVFLRVLAGSVAGLTFSDPLGSFATTTTSSDRRVGGTEVEQVRRLARMFAGQDHQVGSGLSAQAVVTQLSVSATALRGRFAQETVRRQFLSAIADLADITGGMCFDAASHAQAERCFRFAVGCATEADDWSMRAKALSGLANLAVHQGRPDDALSFAELALVRTDRLTPIVHSVMHTRHARALALCGDHREVDCMAAVRQAEDRFAPGGRDEPDWIRYYGEAHLKRDLGRAMVHLAVNGGDHTEARRHLTDAIAHFPDPSRGRTLAVASLAHVTMARDDPAHAVALGNDALDSVDLIRSDRVVEALRQVRTAGLRHRNVPAVRELGHRIDGVLRRTVV
jgi:transcriptional regulator with XRE-family HTH domain